MKKTAAAVFLCIILCGCAADAVSEFEELRAEVQSAESIEIIAELRSELEDESFTFELQCTSDSEETAVEILSPESIAGISAHIKSGETALCYDGAMLDVGSLSENGLSPMTALPVLINAVKSAYISSLAKSGDELEAVLIPDDELTVTLYLLDGAPARAEISTDGITKVFIQINKWSAD